MKKLLCIMLAGGVVFSLGACQKTEANISGVFTNEGKISYSQEYTELSATKKNKTKKWREGMVTGNGSQGVITSGAPYSDTFIFQNMYFIMPNVNSRTCPVTSDELETVKQSIIKGEDITDDQSYDDVYRYHPGGTLRIDMESNKASDYIRYTDYETAQAGVRFTDKNGTWERKTFTSKTDNATITEMKKSSENSKIDLTLSYDDISVMANYGDGDEVNLKYKKIVSDDCEYIGMIAHYPNYENSELKDGGYATLTYVVCEGGAKEKVLGTQTEDEQYVGTDNPGIKITQADSVYLITISERTHDMGKYDDFASANNYELLDLLQKQTKDVANKYTANGAFQYQSALNEHLSVWQPQYNAVSFTLGEGNSNDSNEKLIKAQKKSDELNSELLERAYYAGRYAYLSCAGTSTSRLYGMWTGEWNTGWGSKYTMDANVNLQTSSMNTGNISSAPIGYVNFILRQVPDWEENALATHGFTNAIQAPVNTDGDKAILTESCYPYPFRYWNAGTSWMLQPLYETLQSYGDLQIPLDDAFDLNELKSVLSLTDEDLTDEDIAYIKEKGYLDLREDILLPLLLKGANYWNQLMTPEYYTDKDGNIRYEKGKTSLNDGESYCILPSYSPENNPENYSSPSTANCAIDISACRSNLEMLMDIMKSVYKDADVSQWNELMDKLPPYLYDETGALKEWACNQFEENNTHRHLSHLYCVWPLDETQNDEKLAAAARQAILNRESENTASHAFIHRSLIAARLKDRSSLTEALHGLVSEKIYYDSLMTNHNTNARSCYCTDFSIGYLGMINESLVYSNNGEIEVLPCLPENGFEIGKITGILTRTRATVTSLDWDTTKKIANVTIKSDIEQTIKVSCGLSNENDTQTVSFKASESKTIQFTLK